MRRVKQVGGAVAALAALAVAAARAASGAAPPDGAAGHAPAPGAVVAPGRVEGVTQVVELAFEQAGRIAVVTVTEGQHVEQGDLLARLDSGVAEARVARAAAAVKLAQAMRDAAYNGARPEELAAAEAVARAAAAQARRAAQDRARNEALLRHSAVARAEVDHARAGASASSAQERAARARLDALRNGTREELRRAAQAELEAAEAELEEARVLLAQTELRAPIPGVVLRREAEPGEQVATSPPTVVVAMADVSRLRVRTEVDEHDVARIAVGRRGYAEAKAFGERRFAGRVVQIMPSLGRRGVPNDDPLARNDTRVLEAVFELDAGAQLPVGIRMDVHISAEDEPGGLDGARAAAAGVSSPSTR
jgi:multidrug resistance efflux pump